MIDWMTAGMGAAGSRLGTGALLAQAAPPGAAGDPARAASGGVSVQTLFIDSFDIFTVLLVIGSIVAVAVMVRCLIELRSAVVLPEASERQIRSLIADRRLADLAGFVKREDFYCAVVRAALACPSRQRDAVRNAAELAAGEQCAAQFRKIEPLNVLGNIGPLLGLAGTVWGMVTAFVELRQGGGQAGPAQLSGGIAKALFHTLLGLMLALPALAFFGFYRNRVDRICNRGLAVGAELVELLLEAESPAVPNRAAPSAGGGSATP